MRTVESSIKDRVLALLLALAMLLGSIAGQGNLVFAAPGDDITVPGTEVTEIEVKVEITEDTAEGTTALVSDAKVTFTAEGEEPVEILNGELKKLKVGKAYQYTISAPDNYEIPDHGEETFTPNPDSEGSTRATFARKLTKKPEPEPEKVTITFQTTSGGKAISGINLSVKSGDTELAKVTTAGENGEVSVELEKNTMFAVTAAGEKYETKTVDKLVADSDKLIPIQMDLKPGTVKVQVKQGDKLLQKAKVTYKAKGTAGEGTELTLKNGVGTVTLPAEKTYEFTAVDTGFAAKPVEHEVQAGKETTIPLNMEVEEPDISGSESVNFPDTVTWEVKNKILEEGYTYKWESLNNDIATVDNNGRITPVTVGQVDIRVSVGEKSKTKKLTINQGNTGHPTISIDTNLSDTDQTDVRFNLSDIKEDGTLQINASGECLTESITFTETVSAGQQVVTISFKDNKKLKAPCLQGRVFFNIKFVGTKYTYTPDKVEGLNRDYYRMTADPGKEFEVQLMEGDTPIVPENPDDSSKIYSLVYGAAGTFKIGVKAGGVTGSSLTYSINDEEKKFLEVNAKGEIQINNAGTATVTVTRGEYKGGSYDTYWRSVSADITIKVNKKVLDPIKAVTYTQKNPDKRIYSWNDQTAVAVGEIEVESAGISGGLESGDEGKIYIEASVILASADADTYLASDIKIDDCVLKAKTESDESVLANYTLDVPKEDANTIEKVANPFVIHPKELTIRISNKLPVAVDGVTGAVGIISYDELYKNNEITPGNLKISVEGICEGDSEEFVNSLRIQPISGAKDMGIHEDEIKVNIEDANEAIPENGRSTEDVEKKNYIFKETGEHSWAALYVKEEQLAQNDLHNIITCSGENADIYPENPEKDNMIWIQKTNNGTLSIFLKEEYKNRYTSVLLADDDSNLTDDGIAEGIKISDLSGRDKIKIRLAEKDAAKGYINHSSLLKVPFKLDGKAPTVTYNEPLITGMETAAQRQLSSISFGVFSNKVYFAKFAVTDTSGHLDVNKRETPGSGIESVRTYVWKLTDTDINNGAVDEETIRNKIGNITDWENQEVTVHGNYSVKVGSGSTEPEEGSYLVLVEVTDNVNNTKVYASNGVVVDIRKPTINVTFNNDGKYVSQPKDFYNGNINYRIVVSEDKGLGVSGVAEVSWVVTRDEELVKECSGSEKIDEGKDNLLQFTQDKLINPYEAKKSIDKGNCNSNNLVLTVTAKDRAGNVADEKTYNLCIDTTAPKISVAYNNNSVKNNKYFNKRRVATVTFTERNFDRSKASFDLTLENETKYKGVSLKDINEIDGVEAFWFSDSVDANGETNKEKAVGYTDERTNVAQITFSGDNTYKDFAISCTDMAGNNTNKIDFKDQKAPTNFVIDRTAPVPVVRYYADGKEINPGKSEDERLYSNRVITAIIEVTEHNFAQNDKFAKDQISYSVRGTEVEDKKRITDYQDQAQALRGWTSDGDVRKSRNFEYEVDANYIAGFRYTDLAGNSCSLPTDYFTVDRTSPTGTITVGALGTWSRFISHITFGLFNSKSQKVSLTGYDHTSPVTSVVYTTSYDPMSKAQLTEVTNWTKGKSFSKSANRQFIVYSRITDKAGNTTYLSSEGVILDSKKPGPSITITTDKPAHDVYAGDVPFKIQVEDPTKGETYAGLKSVSYEILNSGKVTQSGNFNESLKPESKRVKSIKKNLSVDSRKNNSNDVTIKVTAVDNAGNTSTKEEKLKIDITKPEISVSYNINSPMNGKFYKDNRVATVTIRERNFDPNNVRFSITNTDGTRPAISSWSNSANSGVSDRATHTCTVSFASDGDYTFTLECTDLAGNRTAYGKTDAFTVDKTAPKIRVSYDNNAVSGGHYYMTERTATVTVTEHNFNAADVKESITASLNSQGITAPVISEFSGGGDTHTATVHFVDSGDYTFDIAYSDMAGNQADAYDGDRFTVDLEKPVIKISGILKANKGPVNPVVEVTDNNYDTSKVTITLEGTKHKAEDMDGSRTAINLGERIHLADLPHTEDVDDIYTLTVRVTDHAGNKQEEKFTFSVNRFGSVYTMGEATEQLLEKYYAKAEDIEDLTVTETNTDSLKHQKITCSKDGEIYELKVGEDYILEEEGASGNWKVYNYQILKENFDKDGKYVVTIYSEDEAKNSSSNQGKNKQIEFVVDRTSPTIVITGIENGARYTEDSLDATIDVKDNIYLKSLRVEIQGDSATEPTVYEFTEEELEKEYGVVTQTIMSANEWQNVKAIATDAAGNEFASESIRIQINRTLLNQLLKNKPLLIGGIAFFLLILALIAYLVRKKRQAA